MPSFSGMDIDIPKSHSGMPLQEQVCFVILWLSFLLYKYYKLLYLLAIIIETVEAHMIIYMVSYSVASARC